MKRFAEFCKSHARLTEKLFIVQMVAYTMVHMNSEQGKSVIWPHTTELPVKIYITSKLEFSLVAKSWGGGAKRHPRPPNFMVAGATAPAAPPVPTPMLLNIC